MLLSGLVNQVSLNGFPYAIPLIWRLFEPSGGISEK